MFLIDPPVGPYSTKEEIDAWIDELKAMEQVPEVIEAIKDAEGYLRR